MIDARPLFVDTSYWVALQNRRDAHHHRAVSWANYIAGTRRRLISTEAVFWEWLNASSHPLLRGRAAGVYRQCRNVSEFEVIGFSDDLIHQAFELFEARSDKEWGLTDCLSFVVMERRGLGDALTADHHFKQAGFEPLLLPEPPTTG
jgi:predicted nucleic acid-binding protein